MRLIKNLPNILTLFNLFLGCLAIIYIFNDHLIIYQVNYAGENETKTIHLGNLDIAAYCVFLAAIVDFFDGFVAKLLHAQSELGKQLDSLADAVTFGVVPGVILYQLFTSCYAANNNAFQYPIVFFAIGFAVTIFGVLRLAKFNIDKRQTTEFRGLPIPSMAIFVMALPIIIMRDELGFAHILANPWVLILITAGLSYLMVSDIPMMSLKLKSLKFEENKWHFLLILVELFLFFIGIFAMHIQFLLLPSAIILYIIISIFKNLKEHGI